MNYTIYDNQQNLRGTFESIYDLERYIDGLRIERDEQYPKTPRMSPFDYVKSIGWFWEVVDNSQVSRV